MPPVRALSESQKGGRKRDAPLRAPWVWWPQRRRRRQSRHWRWCLGGGSDRASACRGPLSCTWRRCLRIQERGQTTGVSKQRVILSWFYLSVIPHVVHGQSSDCVENSLSQLPQKPVHTPLEHLPALRRKASARKNNWLPQPPIFHFKHYCSTTITKISLRVTV